MISVKNVSKRFQGSKHFSVKDISLEIGEGEIFGFLGPNGAGKSTTMKMILGLLWATEGSITVAGYAPDSLESKAFLGFLPEHPSFYKTLSGREFLVFCGEIFGIPKSILRPRVEELLKKVKLSEEASNRAIGSYSKGMQQRIGLAQALINDPKIVFLDEPMSGLDPLGRRMVKEVISDLKKQGKTVFFNSHILSDVEDLCDRIAIIQEGEIVFYGTVSQATKEGMQSLEQAFLNIIGEKDTIDD
jgi:ABC-2 type transport system ATP-binding protein